MEVIGIIRRTIDGVSRKPGEKFELADDLAAEMIEQGVVANANPAPAAEPEADDPADLPVGYLGKQPALKKTGRAARA